MYTLYKPIIYVIGVHVQTPAASESTIQKSAALVQNIVINKKSLQQLLNYCLSMVLYCSSYAALNTFSWPWSGDFELCIDLNGDMSQGSNYM